MPPRPYRVEFPGATQDGFLVRNASWPTLERALHEARIAVNWVLKVDLSPGNDADVAVITNKDTGYRWILRRGRQVVEFQTPEMLAEQVAEDPVTVHWTVEEGEALLSAVDLDKVGDKRTRALAAQAADQARLLCGQVREHRVNAGKDYQRGVGEIVRDGF
jgi:hypothetical protein